MQCYWPLWLDNKKVGRITQQFGEYNPRYAQWGFTKHDGIDIAEAKGLPVHGMTGIVDVIGNDPNGYGLYVSIKDEIQQCWWTYAHLSHIEVKHGQHLLTGDVIGRLGSSGSSTGPHVHVECKPFDYKAYINNGTLGRVAFDWFCHIIVEEEMNAAEYRAVQTRIQYLNTVKFSKGLWLRNVGGEFRQMKSDGTVDKVYGSPEALFADGWQYEDAI
jgi:murein DD-endopeptidase MepM/ murein hydrolase activator NlpD